MSNGKHFALTLAPDQAAFVADCVGSGRWRSADDVMRAALDLLERQEATRRTEVARARDLIADGAADLDRGDVVDAERFFAEWDTELDALEQAARRSA